MGCFKIPKIPKVLLLDWRQKKLFYYLAIIELPLTIACLALFGIADPDTWRTKLWQEGFRNGWNSDPVDILYVIANYQTPNTPRPWDQNTTDYNVAISVLCMFFLLAKVTLYILGGFYPALSAFIHAGELAMYGISAGFQAGPDYLNKQLPSKIPWYISRGCGPPADQSLWSKCMQARANFAVAICMCTLYATYMFWSIYQAIPTQEQRAGIRLTEEAHKSASYHDDEEEKWDFDLDKKGAPSDSPAIQMTPMTPRTQAFNTLSGNMHSRNRDLPLRHHLAMGSDVYAGNQGKGVAM